MTWGGGQAFMQVGILAVSVAAADGREHGVAARNLAFVELAKVHGFVVSPEGPFVTICLSAQVTCDGQPRRQAGEALVGLLHQDAEWVLVFPRDKARPVAVPVTVVHEHGALLAGPV